PAWRSRAGSKVASSRPEQGGRDERDDEAVRHAGECRPFVDETGKDRNIEHNDDGYAKADTAPRRTNNPGEAHGAGSAAATGNVTVNVVPRPSSLWTSMRPRCACTISRAW